MHMCRLCSSFGLTVIKKNETTGWLLCKECLYLQRILEPDYEHIFIDNTVYEWGTVGSNWSEEQFLKQVDSIGGEWRFFCSKITSCTPVRVLDFGSGTGPLLEYLRNQKIDSIGVELSKKNASFSKARGHRVVHELKVGVLLDMGIFNIVHLQNSGTYIRDIFDTFQVFYQILEDRGYIFWQDKVYNWSRYQAGGHMSSDFGPAAVFSKVFLHNLLALTGFQIVYFENKFGHYRLVAQKTSAEITLKGFYWKEYALVKMLPFLDHILPFLHIVGRAKNKILGHG